jgi:hypothetical protein
MVVFRKYLFVCLGVICLITSCKGKKKASLAGDDPVEVSDLIGFFPEKRIPFTVSDSSLLKKENDSLLISHTTFTQFIPDSLLQPIFGKNVKPKFYPLARIEGDNELYLIAKGITPSKKAALILAFSKKDEYLHGIPLLVVDASNATQQTSTVDKNYGIHVNLSRKNKDGSISDGKDVYGFSASSKKIMLIMTDAMDDVKTEVINPIDTLSRKFKYAADYGTGNMNIISIRDGRRSGMLSFFIHIDKNQGACTGELKGDAVIRSATTAEYRQAGDPCVLRFTFSSNSVTLKEVEGCGAHRTLRCSFDGNYSKKKAPKKIVDKK